MRDELKEWYKEAQRGTRGDMVFDILKDWKKERARAESDIARLKAALVSIQEVSLTEADELAKRSRYEKACDIASEAIKPSNAPDQRPGATKV